jgi:hypothetical protein
MRVLAGVKFGAALIAMSLASIALARNPSTSSTRSTPLAGSPAGSTLWQALATTAFLVFGLTTSIWGMIYAGVALFNVDIFKERGFDEKLCFNSHSHRCCCSVLSRIVAKGLTNRSIGSSSLSTPTAGRTG